MPAYTNVAKPTGASYTNISKPTGANYTNVSHETLPEFIQVGMLTGLIAPPVYSKTIRLGDPWTRVSKPISI